MKTKKLFLILFTFFTLIQIVLPDEYKVPQYAYGLDICDIDHDGDFDIVVGSFTYTGNDTMSILINDGYGNFTWSYFTRSNRSKIFCSCMDSDSLPDIISRNSIDSAWVYYPNFGDGAYGNSHIIYKTSDQTIDVFNLDQNNSSDFICYDQSPSGILNALNNDGSGYFSLLDIYVSNEPISQPDVGDINGDSLNDILMSDYNVGVLIFYNQGNGVFNWQIIDVNPASYTYIFDIDNDGDNDLGLYEHEYLPGGICTLKIYENQSYNFVLTETILFPTGTLFRKFVDFNNDNYFDIAYIRSIWREPIDSLYIVLNNQNLGFTSPDRYFVHNPQLLSVKSADFDGNSYNDIAYSYYGAQDSVMILFNEGSGKFVDNPLTSIKTQDSKDFQINVYPNPFRFTTRIRIENVPPLKNLQKVITICDIRGKIIKTRLIENVNAAGENYEIYWDGKDNQGNRCSSGIYLLECNFGNIKYFTKIILVNN
jgi:hypothetical protein